MASGYNQLHPIVTKVLKELGVDGSKITQTVGAAVASAGFHSAEGTIDGHGYTSCVDLSWSLASVALKSHLVEAGFAPFFRYPASGWLQAKHIHAIYIGLRDEDGDVRILPGPRQQIIDAYKGLNGLAGHSTYRGDYMFTDDEKAHIKASYASWVPDIATTVIGLDGKQITCYAFFEGDTVRCEVRPLFEHFGVEIVGWQGGQLVCKLDDKVLDLSGADCEIAGGQFTRGNVRQLVEAIGLKIEFEMTGSSATVKLSE